MVGGHVVKTGVAPLIIDLMERRVITHLAMNGSGAIHDYEIARFGATSEDVARGLIDGTFGMAEETGRGMNEAFIEGMKNEWGMGEAVARALEKVPLAHPEMSLLLAAQRLGVEAASCIVIEDSVLGVKAARAAGMAVIGFAGGSHANQDLAERLAAAGAEPVIHSMARLPAAVEQWVRRG